MSATAQTVDQLMQDPEQKALMQVIKQRFATLIRSAVAGTPIPESFLAALTAGESGGDLLVSRYEGYELSQFALVLCAKRPNYQGITSPQLTARLNGVFSIAAGVKTLVDHCTSWGPTQIMGWQSIKRGYKLAELQDVTKHFPHAIELLLDFSRQFYRLDVGRQIAPTSIDATCNGLFHCWNAGAPDKATTDPMYATRGLARMKIYEALP